MAFRSITDHIGWEPARSIVRFTAACLKGFAEHQKLAAALQKLLEDWNPIEENRRAVEDAVMDANALVSALDYRLDLAVGQLVNRIAFECDGNRNHKLFKAFFPEPPNEIIRMALEGEIARTQAFHAVAKEVGPSKEVLAILKTIAAVQTEGRHALAAREEALTRRTRLSLRMQTWKENANAARRSVENALDAYAIENSLPRTYADEFFPAPIRKPKAEHDSTATSKG